MAHQTKSTKLEKTTNPIKRPNIPQTSQIMRNMNMNTLKRIIPGATDDFWQNIFSNIPSSSKTKTDRQNENKRTRTESVANRSVTSMPRTPVVAKRKSPDMSKATRSTNTIDQTKAKSTTNAVVTNVQRSSDTNVKTSKNQPKDSSAKIDQVEKVSEATSKATTAKQNDDILEHQKSRTKSSLPESIPVQKSVGSSKVKEWKTRSNVTVCILEQYYDIDMSDSDHSSAKCKHCPASQAAKHFKKGNNANLKSHLKMVGIYV